MRNITCSTLQISGGHTITEAMKQDGCSKEYVNVVQNLGRKSTVSKIMNLEFEWCQSDC